MNKKGFINIIIIGIVVLIIAAAGYFAVTRKTSETPATTQETETNSKTKIKNDLLTFLKNDGSIWIIDFTNNKQAIKIVAPPSKEDPIGEMSGNFRSWSLSPNGDQIAFDFYRDGNLTGIAIASTTHYSQPQFLHAGTNPKWSPVDNDILFVNEGKIKLISLSDNKIKNFEGANALLTPYSWFKDGVHFLASNRINYDMERYIVNKNTGEKQPLKVPELERVKGGIIYYYPIISPATNEFVAKIFYGNKKSYDIAVFNTSGSSFKILSPLAGESWPGSGYTSPNWSPDGNQISYIDIFCDIKSDCPSKFPLSSLTIVNKDGSAGRKIIINGAGSSGMDETVAMPCWLPSGKDIVFLNRNNVLSVVNLESKKVRLIDGSDNIYGFLCNR